MKKFFISILAFALIIGNILSCGPENTDTSATPLTSDQGGGALEQEIPEGGSDSITEEPEKDPEPMNFEIDGVSITEYKIVYGTSDGKSSAKFLQSEILAATGTNLEIISDVFGKTKYEIVVGDSSRRQESYPSR